MVCHWAILEARSLMPLLSSDAPFFSRNEIQFAPATPLRIRNKMDLSSSISASRSASICKTNPRLCDACFPQKKPRLRFLHKIVRGQNPRLRRVIVNIIGCGGGTKNSGKSGNALSRHCDLIFRATSRNQVAFTT